MTGKRRGCVRGGGVPLHACARGCRSNLKSAIGVHRCRPACVRQQCVAARRRSTHEGTALRTNTHCLRPLRQGQECPLIGWRGALRFFVSWVTGLLKRRWLTYHRKLGIHRIVQAEIVVAFAARQRQRCVAETLSFGVALPTQLLCVWSPFLFLLFLTLRLDEVSESLRFLDRDSTSRSVPV